MDNISVSHEFVRDALFNYMDKFSEKLNVDKRDVKNLIIRLKKIVKEHEGIDNERTIESKVSYILRDLDTTIDSGNIPDKQLVGLKMIAFDEVPKYECANFCIEKTCSKLYNYVFTVNLFSVVVHVPLCRYHFDLVFEISRFFRHVHTEGGEKICQGLYSRR